jgi:hypothetical protein
VVVGEYTDGKQKGHATDETAGQSCFTHLFPLAAFFSLRPDAGPFVDCIKEV